MLWYERNKNNANCEDSSLAANAPDRAGYQLAAGVNLRAAARARARRELAGVVRVA